MALSWYFSDQSNTIDHRLYKQTIPTGPAPKKKKTDPPATEPRIVKEESWTILCDTSHEWESFPETLKESKAKADKELYTYLTRISVDIVAHLRVITLHQLIAQSQERAAEKSKLLDESIASRKRSFRVQLRELEKLEIQNLEYRDEVVGPRGGRPRISPRMSKEQREALVCL